MSVKLIRSGRTEAQVLAQVLDALQIFGIDADRQNTGAMTNPKGQHVRFGRPGNADISGTLPDGRTLHIEVKREDFDPGKLRGEKRAHFDRQLARLRKTNELGGVAFWADNVDLVIVVLRAVLEGGRVEEDGEGGLRVIFDRGV